MNTITKPAAGFWVITIILLLWNIVGVLSFVGHLMITDEMIALLEPAEQALYAQYPMWTYVVFAAATIFGLLGAVLLIARRKYAKLIYTISLLAILIQMTHNLFITDSVAVHGPMSVVFPILVIIIGIFSVWYSSYTANKGWLK